MHIKIQKSFRKSLSLKLDRNGVLQVKAPFFVTQKQIENFIEKHRDWIEKQQQKLPEILSEEKINTLIMQAKTDIPPRVAYFAEKYGFSYQQIRITRAQTRWGSCSSRNNLSFSYRLMLSPQECIDYVIVHELCHLRQMNHSQDFWREVAAILPDYKTREKYLKNRNFEC